MGSCRSMEKTIQWFLACLPVRNLHFPPEVLSLEGQKILLNATVNSDLVLKHPLRCQYQKAFLKRLLDQLEALDLEIHEALYASYVRLVAKPQEMPSSRSFNHYRVGCDGDVVTLIEDDNLISQGTTGLRTWKGAVALSEWCLSNQSRIAGNTVLELGSGLGLTGLVACRRCRPRRYCFSDCHPAVLRTLTENIALNFPHLSCSKLPLDLEVDKTMSVSVLDLPWGSMDRASIYELGKIDLVLAADVVYDPDLFQDLLKALQCLSAQCSILACTERNSETLNKFLKEAERFFTWTEQPCPIQKHFIWEPSPAVRIFEFRLK